MSLKKELMEQARLNGMGAERELHLIAKNERLQREVEAYKQTSARLMSENLDLRRALNEIRDATHTNAVTLRGMADMALGEKK